MSGLVVVFGAAQLGPERAFQTEESARQLLEVLHKHNIRNIDSAQLYTGSEELLGKVDAAQSFIIDTKIPGGFIPGSVKKDSIISSFKESLRKLKTDKVDILYIHSPDAGIPLSETLEGINEVYKSGGFSRFGLSNYKAEDVSKVYDYCKEHGFVLPSVYQGNYSAVARKQETLLFPLLRKLNIAFYAYSPIAGGFLTKSKQDILDGKGRFNKSTPIGAIYADMYAKESLLEALGEWEDIAKDAGCSQADLAYRWVTFNSPLKAKNGDAIIVGASSVTQLEQTMKGLHAGPLDKKTADRIDQIWSKIEHEAPLDNFHK